MLPGAMTLYWTWRTVTGATWTGYCSLVAALGFLRAESSEFEQAAAPPSTSASAREYAAGLVSFT